VRALMYRLFAAESDRRRMELTEALQAAAPSRVEALRRTLDPSEREERTETEPLIVQALSQRTPPVGEQRRNKLRAMVIGGAVVFAIAAAGLVAARIGAAKNAATSAKTAITSTPSSAPALSSAPAQASSAPVAPAPTTKTAATTPTSTSTPTSTPTSTRVGGRNPPAGIPKGPPGPAAPTNKLPNVDPTPF
jgi:hypothetical protein